MNPMRRHLPPLPQHHHRSYENLSATLTTRRFIPHTNLYPPQRRNTNLSTRLTTRSNTLHHWPAEMHNHTSLLPLDIKKVDLPNVLHEKKLPLLVDLDHTLIHAIVDIPLNMPGVETFACRSGTDRFLISMRYRPGAKEFLERIASRFELIVCTKGTLSYAKKVVKYLDPTGTLFKGRIIANEHFVTENSKEEILRSITKCGNKSHILVIDDSPEMWSSTNTLIPVKKYYFDGFKYPGFEDKDSHLLYLEETLCNVHNDFFKEKHKSLSIIVNHQIQHMQQMDGLLEAFQRLKIQ